MSGLKTSIVNEIKKNLRDSYHSGFPVLKELIQNADDSDASQFIFGNHLGFGEKTQHLLLKGPALWFANNGGFTASDKDAIASFSINAKAGESHTIGKYGLGMKSVFHWCESFFYIAYDGKDMYCDFINPWDNNTGKHIHSNWDIVSEKDWALIREECPVSISSGKTWFLLWIPLRKQSQLIDPDGKKCGAIVHECPGDNYSAALKFLGESELPKKLGKLLPLLSNLQTIEFIPVEKINSEPTYKLIHNAENRLSLTENSINEKTFSHGEVVISRNNKTTPSIVYLGQKYKSRDDVFVSYKDNSSWPETLTTDEHGFDVSVKDKSRAEGAVVISHSDGASGMVTCQWAVFLPLEEEQLIFEKPIPNSSRRYQFIFHGQFFIDAGRRGINGFERFHQPSSDDNNINDEKSLCQNWNQELAQRVTLPLLLPTLREYIKQYKLKDKEILALTEAVSEFAKKYRDYVCSQFNWARLLNENDAEWALLERKDGSRILPIPAPPRDDSIRPWRVFPSLKTIKNIHFIDAHTASIISSDSKSEQWTEYDLSQIFIKCNPEIFIKTGDVDYLSEMLSWFASTPYFTTLSIQKSLSEFIRQGIRHHSLKSLDKNKQKIQNIIGNLNSEKRLALGTVDNNSQSAISENMWETLWSCETTILPIPTRLDHPVKKSSGKPSPDDVSTWLKALQEYVIAPSTEQSAVQLIRDLLNNLNIEGREGVIKTNRELKLIRVFNPLKGKYEVVSYAEILESQHRQNIFSFSGGTTKQQTKTKLLSNALPNEIILLLLKDERDLFFPHTKLPSSDSSSDILKSLLQCNKQLGDFQRRKSLIKTIHNTDNDEAILGLRYLLHGNEQQLKNDRDDLWTRGDKQSSAWEKLWKFATGIKENKEWQVISSDLVDLLTKGECKQLRLNDIEPNSVISKLQNIDLTEVLKIGLSLEEREEILLGIEDVELWKRMPLHKTVKGTIQAIDGKSVLLPPHLELPEELSQSISIIEPSKKLKAQQNKRIENCDEIYAAKLALKADRPEKYFLFLMRLLDKIDDEDLKGLSEYKDKKWLLLSNNQKISPSDIIDISEMEDDIQRLAPEGEYCYACKKDLPANIVKHQAYQKLESLFSNTPEDALGKLGLLLTEVDGYAVGKFSFTEKTPLTDIAKLLSSGPLKGWSIIDKAVKNFSEKDCHDYLLPNLQDSPLTPETIKTVLNWLYEKISDGIKVQKYSDVYYQYLEQLFNNSKDLPNVYLQTKDKKVWKKPAELCINAASVDKEYVLDDKFFNLLSSRIVTSTRESKKPEKGFEPIKNDLITDEQETFGCLVDYFSKWEKVCRSPIIGAFLALLGLGRNEAIREKTGSYLEPHTFDWYSEELNWIDPGRRSDDVLDWMGGLCVKDALDKLTFTVEIVELDREKVRNLFGDLISVPLASLNNANSSLLSGDLGGSGDCVHLKLRKIDVYKLQEELPRLIESTCDYILKFAYNQKGAINRKSLWDTLNQTDQLEIEVVRARIFKHLIFYLKQLGAHQLPEIKDKVIQYEKEETQITEAKIKNRSDENLKELEKNLAQTQKQLVEILANDRKAQAALLEKMRLKLLDYQYDAGSVLFELFQNADDAITELGKCESYPSEEVTIPEACRHFVVLQRDSSFTVMHWGRPINYRGSSEIKEQWPGFGQDLEKMLILSASDKPSDASVTGRFGLGFKSVFLVCDEPRLLSGDLRVKIAASILPEPWEDNCDSSIKLLADHTRDRRYKGTLIDLPINEKTEISLVGKRFEALIPLLPIFSKSIRNIQFNEDYASWKPEYLLDSLSLEASNIESFGRILVSRLKVENGDAVVALRVNARGIDLFDKDIPSLWVTAPTREDASFGFIISAPFRIDAGRGKLAGDGEENKEIASKIGKKFGSDLVQLYNHDWGMLRSRLNLSSDVTPSEFWASFWLRLTERVFKDDSSIAIGRAFVISLLETWSNEVGLIPNGLEAKQSKLIPQSEITYALPKLWGEQIEVVSLLSQWNLFKNKYTVEQLISEKILKIWRVVFSDSNIVTLDIQNLVGLVVDSGCCDNGSAETLQKIFEYLYSEKAVDSLNKNEKGLMSQLEFKSKAGHKQKNKLLLCTTDAEKEEKLRTTFAPDEFLLSNEYSNDGIKFFRQCRLRTDLHDSLECWIINATKNKQESALRYLLDGEKGTEVGRKIRDRLNGTWLDEFSPTHPSIAHWEEVDKVEICRLLMREILVFPQLPQDYSINEYSETTLVQIYNWWIEEGKSTELRRYYKHLYPRDKRPNLTISVEGEYDREAWMMIFSLGVFQSFGRVTSAQNKGFIEYLQSNQWWLTFCKNPKEDGEEWLSILHEYAKKQNDDESYSQWLDSYPRLFKIAIWLDDYIDLFESIDQRTEEQTLHILTPNTDIELQGAGWGDIPPLNRTLKNGFHLIVRELIKQNVISSQSAYCHAYMPVKRIKEMIYGITGREVETSKQIYEVLCDELGTDKASFDGDFDIPLLILAERPDLAKDFNIEFEPEDNYS